jgi:sortase A
MMRPVRHNPYANRFFRWCSRGCLLGGVAALLVYGYLWADAYVYQARQDRRFQDSASTVRPSEAVIRGKSANTGQAIGKIEIPRIGLSVVVLEGDDERALRLGAGWIPNTARPGEAGNIGIAAHRDTFFRGLRNVRKDDVIRLVTSGGFYSYRVESTEVVDPSRIDVLNSTVSPTLTLITCYPFYYVGPAPKRFVVVARLVSSSARSTERETDVLCMNRNSS